MRASHFYAVESHFEKSERERKKEYLIPSIGRLPGETEKEKERGAGI